jgi:hypothetical protein
MQLHRFLLRRHAWTARLKMRRMWRLGARGSASRTRRHELRPNSTATPHPEKALVQDHIWSVLCDTSLRLLLDAIMSDQSIRRPARSAAWAWGTS